MEKVSAATEPGRLGRQVALFDHALRLHRATPDAPLPRDGEPYPDEGRHRRRSRPRAPKDRRFAGIEVAAILDEHFRTLAGRPADLAEAFHDVYVPAHPNDHITAAACRVDAVRAGTTGRWLVRRATDRCAVLVGLALLATTSDEGDIPLIQTIGLLSDTFSPLAARALERRRASRALQWLGERVAGWGRVYVVEALCRTGGVAARPWLLRHSCDGSALNGYFAGTVATDAHLHEAITAADVDSELVDHTGRLLAVMGYSDGMGMTLDTYPPAAAVIAAYVGHVSRLEPTLGRYSVTAEIAEYLHRAGSRWERILGDCVSVLNRDDWSECASSGLAAGDAGMAWLAERIGPQLGLRPFTEPPAERATPKKRQE